MGKVVGCYQCVNAMRMNGVACNRYCYNSFLSYPSGGARCSYLGRNVEPDKPCQASGDVFYCKSKNKVLRYRENAHMNCSYNQ